MRKSDPASAKPTNPPHARGSAGPPRPARHLRWLGAAGLAVAVLALTFAVRRGPSPASDTTAPVDADTAPLQNTHRPIADEVDDPRRDGWRSEAFHAAAKKTLIAVGKWITAAVNPTPQPADSLASQDFQASLLVPADLERVYEHGPVIVLRPAGSPSDVPLDPERGPSALSRAVERMRSRWQEWPDLHAEIKVVRLLETDAGFETMVDFEFHSRSPDRNLQVNAVWECAWAPWKDGEHPHLRRIRLKEYEQIEVRGTAAPRFTDATEAVLGADTAYRQQMVHGVGHWIERIEAGVGVNLYSRYGGAVGDVNGDGREDLYVCQPGGLPNRLFVQAEDGTAFDDSARAGVDWLDDTRAALLVDLDNDDDLDLVLACRGRVVIHSNDGTGRFEVKASLPVGQDTQSLAAADYNRDGYLDVYVCVARAEEDDTARAPRPMFVYHNANDGSPNHLFRNDGVWNFVDVTLPVGLDVDNRRHSLAAAWEDYDDDGDPDLYVANDYGANVLYRNDRGVFTNVAAMAGVEDYGSGMSADWGDYDGDGRVDLYIGNMFSSAGGRIVPQSRFRAGDDTSVRDLYARFARGNSLFRSRGDGTFEDVSLAAGVTMGRWAWSSLFADLNNDGFEDLVVANGYITAADPGDL